MIFDTGSRENLVSIAHPVIEGERLIKNEFPRKFSGAFSPQATTSSHHVFLDLELTPKKGQRILLKKEPFLVIDQPTEFGLLMGMKSI